MSFSTAHRWAEVRVVRDGPTVERVLLERPDGEPLDITGYDVLSVERVVSPHDVPEVRVTFAARLVEVDVPTIRARRSVIVHHAHHADLVTYGPEVDLRADSVIPSVTEHEFLTDPRWHAARAARDAR